MTSDDIFGLDLSFLESTKEVDDSKISFELSDSAPSVSNDADVVGDNNSNDSSDPVLPDHVAELVGDFADDDGVLEAAKALEQMHADIEEAEQLRITAEEERQAIMEQAAEARAVLDALLEKQSALTQTVHQSRMKYNNRRNLIVTKERELSEAKRLATIRREALLEENMLDERAKQFDWYNGIMLRGKEYKIMGHQMQAAKFIVNGKKVILGDDMGLGKTLSAIAALDLAGAKRVLIITPADVTSNFVSEIHEWAPHRPVMDIKGMSKAHRTIMLDAFNSMDSFVVVANYEAWRKDLSLLTKLGDMHFDSIICDEAHVMKDTSTVNFKGVADLISVRNICPKCNSATMMRTMPDMREIGANNVRTCVVCKYRAGEAYDLFNNDWKGKDAATRSVKNVLLMTGTPILNSPTDLYSLLALLEPDNYTSRAAFERQFCKTSPITGVTTFADGGLSRVTQRLKGIYLARNREDAGIILPPQKPILHLVELTEEAYPNQYRVAKQLRENAEIILSSGDKMSVMETIALITRQRQANVFPGGIQIKDEDGNVVFSVGEEVTESIKLDKALEIISERVDAGHRIVLFSQFSTALKEMERRLGTFVTEGGRRVRAVTMTGATPTHIRDQVKTNFDRKMGEEPKWDIVLANYKSGGVGLNFTAATQAIVLDREWNPGKENQALARILRMGQTEETTVHTIEIEGSIDLWLNGLIEGKKAIVDGFTEESRDMQADLLSALKNNFATE